MIIVDASALIEVLLQTPAAPSIEKFLFDPTESLHAPELLDIEVLQVLRRYEATNLITSVRGSEAVTDFLDFRITKYPHNMLLPRIWELRKNLTAYDSAYIALAETLDATLVTCDRRIKNAPGHSAKVQLVSQ